MAPGHRLSRRDLVRSTIAAAAAAACARMMGTPLSGVIDAARFAPRSQVSGAALGLVIRNERPLDAETPLAALGQWKTPNDLFFVRSHFGTPENTPAKWTLTVDGEVGKSLTLSLDD